MEMDVILTVRLKLVGHALEVIQLTLIIAAFLVMEVLDIMDFMNVVMVILTMEMDVTNTVEPN